MKNILGTTFLDRIQRIAVETQHYQHIYHDVRRCFSAEKSDKRDLLGIQTVNNVPVEDTSSETRRSSRFAKNYCRGGKGNGITLTKSFPSALQSNDVDAELHDVGGQPAESAHDE